MCHALIESHLFCVDNLCDDEIRAHLAEERQFESNPVRYEGQAPMKMLTIGGSIRTMLTAFTRQCWRESMLSAISLSAPVKKCVLCVTRHSRLTITRQVSD